MKLSPLVTIYSITLLLSAALLFSVQPMFSKMILPLLGGTPQVWNTCMLFFQTALLAGYAYAHGTTKFLNVRTQAIVHFGLLLVFIAVLPLGIPAAWVPPEGEDPTLWQLGVMAATVGGPFFILAASAPMFQRWFAASKHKDADNPYFLYGASNLGSITALLAYPVIIEPLLTLSGQAQVWMVGYIVLIIMTVVSAAMVWKTVPKTEKRAKAKKAITWKQRITWIILSFIPSSLMLGVTTFITMDIAAVPLLWILPLSLYVGTFIIVFARKPIITYKQSVLLQGVGLIVLIALKISQPISDPMFLVGTHLAVFFFSALTCHSLLVKSKPDASNLTEFYLLMSFGGALGGFFNAILAPQFFVIPLEYVFALVLAAFARYALEPEQDWKHFTDHVRASFKEKGIDALSNGTFITAFVAVFATAFIFAHDHVVITIFGAITIAVCMGYVIDKRWVFGGLVLMTLVAFPLGYHWSGGAYNKVLHRDRNYFGIIKIADTANGERIMLHGTTNHGTQAQEEKYRLTPLSYYSENSPMRDVYKVLDNRPAPQKVGVIGLGVGVTACFQKKGRSIDYFEIDKLVKEIAEDPKYFTFLKDCGSPYNIILGDGRLTLKKQPDANYDLIMVDAFTSDNIPVHLLTTEAIELYKQKIKSNGIILIHISNRYLDLEPVLSEASGIVGIPAYAKVTEGGMIEGTKYETYGSHWVVFTKDPGAIKALEADKWTPAMPRQGVMAWSDQYSNVFRVLNNVTGFKRSKAALDERKKIEELKGETKKAWQKRRDGAPK